MKPINYPGSLLIDRQKDFYSLQTPGTNTSSYPYIPEIAGHMGQKGHLHNHALNADPDPVTLDNRVRSALWIGIILNSLFVLVEAVAGFRTRSLALLSDAGHNFGDVVSLALALLAFGLSRIRSSPHYTYGYRKTTILVALLNAVLLLLAIGGLGYEALRRLSAPEALPGQVMALVAGVGILVNAFSAWIFQRTRRKDLNIRAAYLHMASDALVAAGVVGAGLLIYYTHWYWIDSAMSLVIMLVILLGTWKLLTESLRLSLDGVPRTIDLEQVETNLKKVQGVRGVHHIHVWAISTTENALTAHIEVDPSTDLGTAARIRNSLAHEMEHLHIRHSTFELEPSDEHCAQEDCRDCEPDPAHPGS